MHPCQEDSYYQEIAERYYPEIYKLIQPYLKVSIGKFFRYLASFLNHIRLVTKDNSFLKIDGKPTQQVKILTNYSELFSKFPKDNQVVITLVSPILDYYLVKISYSSNYLLYQRLNEREFIMLLITTLVSLDDLNLKMTEPCGKVVSTKKTFSFLVNSIVLQ